MKTIRKSILHFQQGNSDKVYEADLVEVSTKRYIVNFRYGRRGNSLSEGCKTKDPVELSKAQDIFNSLLISKINKGYELVSGYNPLEENNSDNMESSSPSESLSTRDQLITSRLEKFTQGRKHITSFSAKDRTPYIDGYSLSRTIWKAGEYEIEGLAHIFDQLIATKKNKESDILNYSIAWAIGRTKDIGSLPVLDNLQPYLSYKLHYIVDEARLALTNTVNSTLAPLRDMDKEALVTHKDLTYLSHKDTLRIYQYAKNHTQLHEQFSNKLHLTALDNNFMRSFRTLYKIAEFREDYALLALLNYKLENTRALPWQWNAEVQAYSQQTREYFRRRMVREIKKVGKNKSQNYTQFATQVLLQINDNDSKERLKSDNDSLFDPYLLTANYILYANSQRYQPSAGKAYWRIHSNSQDRGRVEAHPILWDKAPEDAFTLLMNCKSLAVNNFSLARVESHKTFCQQVSPNDLLSLVQKPYRNTAIFAATYLKPDINAIKILRAVLNSPFEEVRKIALDAIDAKLFEKQPELLAELLCSPYEEIYQYAKDHIYTAKRHETELSDALINAAINALNAQPHDEDNNKDKDNKQLVEQVRWLLLNPLKAKASLNAIERLLRSDPLALKILATELLETSNYHFDELKTCYRLMMNSEHPEVQAGAIALLHKLNERDRIKQKELLFSALISEAALIREKAIPIVLSIKDRRFQHDTFNAILPELFKKEPVEGYADDLISVINGLQSIHSDIDKDVVWRLLTARSKMADRAGAIILEARSDQEFSIKQIAILGKNSSLSVRNWSLAIFQKDTRRVERHFEDALRILDNRWADTRALAIEFFANNFSKKDWNVTRIIGVCDNVYPDTQRFGRELVSQFFEEDKGEEYLLKLSQHPSNNVQLFVSSFLESYATDKSSTILLLAPYFKTVLSQVNKSRIIKDRIIKFLFNESEKQDDVAKMVGELFSDQSLTVVLADKSKYIATLLQLQSKHNDMQTPLKIIQPERRAVS